MPTVETMAYHVGHHGKPGYLIKLLDFLQFQNILGMIYSRLKIPKAGAKYFTVLMISSCSLVS